MRPINLIVIHCSATPNSDSLFRGTAGQFGFQTPVSAINEWHRKRGFHRSDLYRQTFNPSLDAIGYHFVIYRSGLVVTGRCEDEVGAHVQGFNQKSLGICLIGIDHFTAAQWASLKDLVGDMMKRHGTRRVLGHRDLSPDQNKNGIVEPFEWLKTCPGFDVATWMAGDMAPLKTALWEEAHG